MSKDRVQIRRGMVYVVAAVGCLAVSGWLTLQADPPPQKDPGPPIQPPTVTEANKPKTMTIEEYRKLYPFVSLTGRLEYEKTHPRTAAPKPTVETEKRLDELEKSMENVSKWNPRQQSLEALHSAQTDVFIKSPGFGFERTPRPPSPSPRFLELASAPTIPFDSVPSLSGGAEGTKVPLPKKAPDREKSLMPTEETVSNFHLQGEVNFLNPMGFGYVKDREHVAGFQSHQFRHMPELPGRSANPTGDSVPPSKSAAKPVKEKWAVRGLELVSLLKNDKPAVYVSDELPRMDDLKKRKTRSLSEFEEQALKSLQAGEDVVTEAQPNRIHMLGSLRATKQCMECHEVQRGELLGAFTYDLQRDPPVAVER